MGNKVKGQKLEIFLIDGSTTGPKIIEIGNWSGKAICCPRASLKNLLGRPEFKEPGVYFLQSQSETYEYAERIYIGEAEELGARMKKHMASSHDFESAICFSGKELTKAHIKFLEARLISLAREAKSSMVENKTSPQEPRLSEADVCVMETFLELIGLILPFAGIRALVPAVAHPVTSVSVKRATKVFTVKSSKLVAYMVEVDGAFIVKADSEAMLTTVNSLGPGWAQLRNKLVSTHALEKRGDKLVFVKDTGFASPSAASSVVLGRQAPGPISWIDERGKTYKQVQEEQNRS